MENNNTVAFITGVTGQDGSYLAALLLMKGYKVYGGFRRGAVNKTWRLDYLGITEKVTLIESTLSEPQYLIEIMKNIQPDEVYNLAGESFVADSFKYPGITLEANTHGTINVLEAARLVSPQSRLFFASSSEVFGRTPEDELLNENSRHQPCNPYAISKLAADYFVKLYREEHGLFACSGFLFNHESPLRARQFVTRKISYNIARLKVDGGKPFELGDLNSARDWGSAEDYVEAMYLMLSMSKPDDYVIATGKLTPVREILKLSALSAGFDPVFENEGQDEVCIDRTTGMKIAQVSEKYFRPHDTVPLVGDPTKIESHTGWKRLKNFEHLIDEMVMADIDRWNRGDINV